MEHTQDPLLAVENLSVKFRETPILKRVSFALRHNQIMGIVGGSGSGKSSLALALLRLLPKYAEITGSAYFEGEDLFQKSEASMRQIRGQKIGLILQDPISSLDPLMTIGNQLIEGMLCHLKISKKEAKEKGLFLLESVGISDPCARWNQYPHELSGGMCQRIGIASALSLEPNLIIADEATSSLDVTLQAEILELLLSIRKNRGTSILFITHDLAVLASLCDEVLVLQEGALIEHQSCSTFFSEPIHPFSKKLIESAKRRYV